MVDQEVAQSPVITFNVGDGHDRLIIVADRRGNSKLTGQRNAETTGIVGVMTGYGSGATDSPGVLFQAEAIFPVALDVANAHRGVVFVKDVRPVVVPVFEVLVGAVVPPASG